MLLCVIVFAPMSAALVSYITGRYSKTARNAVVGATGAAVFALSFFLWGKSCEFAINGFCGLGIRFRADGFRSLYGTIAAFMWAISGLFSPDYFKHYHNRNRYYFFNLITLGATLGVFYSDDLYTTLIFFEIMSLTSFTWVAQEETDGALRAAGTYLAVAVIGGLATLMGLFILYRELGTLTFDGMHEAVSLRPAGGDGLITAASWLTLIGFAAKAGMAPLHIWLPKAHPVAPAPASALLSGILTKTGIFGILVIAARLMYANAAFANLLLVFACVTMFAGALLALFSVDLKRTLACSSMSQIGFISVGVCMLLLLGEEGSLAAYGTVLHMVNHSLIKLCLFLCAGTVYMNLHKLDLNEIRGFGRKKPLLHFCFLSGAVSIACIPPFGSGYNSKSLLHEGILEWIEVLKEEGSAWGAYKFVEILFLISGGLTVTYMTKLYICLFVKKNTPKRQAEFDGMKDYISPLSAFVLTVVSILLPLFGLFGSRLMTPLASRSMEFLKLEPLGHDIAYFSAENLIGAAKSIAIGALVYLAVVKTVMIRKGEYVDLWPKKLDLENLVYRPALLKILPGALGAVTGFIARIPESALVMKVIPKTVSAVTGFFAKLPESRCVFVWLPGFITALTRFASEIPEKIVLFLRNTVFSHRREAYRVPVGNRLTWHAGRFVNAVARALNATLLRSHPMRTDFEYVFDAANKMIDRGYVKLSNTVSFGLLLTAVGLFVTCLYLLMH